MYWYMHITLQVSVYEYTIVYDCSIQVFECTYTCMCFTSATITSVTVLLIALGLSRSQGYDLTILILPAIVPGTVTVCLCVYASPLSDYKIYTKTVKRVLEMTA